MNLADIERHSSRAQTLSIVDSARFKIALWFGSVSAGKTVASLFAFLIAVRLAPSSGLIVIVGKSLQTVYQNVFVLFWSGSHCSSGWSSATRPRSSSTRHPCRRLTTSRTGS